MTTKAYRANYDLIEWKPLQCRPGLAREARARGPYFIPDIEPYVSPLDGSVVSSRSHHRDHMRAHGVVEAGTDKPKPTTVKPLPDVRHDIREAYEMLTAMHDRRESDALQKADVYELTGISDIVRGQRPLL